MHIYVMALEYIPLRNATRSRKIIAVACVYDIYFFSHTDPCPYVQMDPPYLFGVWEGGDIIQVGTCGEDGYFNDTSDICTCTLMYGKETRMIFKDSCSITCAVIFF